MQVVEQVRPLHVVQHDVVVLTVLKQVDQVDDVGVLAHFEDFNLSSLLEDLDVGHVLLLDLFDGHFLFGLFVGSKLHKTELALAQGFVEIIELKHVGHAHGVLEDVAPLGCIVRL